MFWLSMGSYRSVKDYLKVTSAKSNPWRVINELKDMKKK